MSIRCSLELKPRIERLVFTTRKAVTQQFLQDAKRKLLKEKQAYKEGEGGLALLRAHQWFT
jgi:preprotein translocase subunit SecA